MSRKKNREKRKAAAAERRDNPSAPVGGTSPCTGEAFANVVKLGDVVTRVPVTLGDPTRGVGNSSAPPMQGRVVYVHPEGRFHTVEFADGHPPVRESFCGVRR